MTKETSKNRDHKPDERTGALRPVRWILVLLLGLPLIVLHTGWVAYSEMKTYVTEITISSLFIGVTFLLFLLTLLNLLAARLLGQRRALSQPELMALYVMLSMSGVVAGVGHFGFFAPFLSNLFWFANPTNRWEQFWPLVPAFVGPRDREILKGFYEGRADFFQPEVLRAWAYPLLVWGLFFLVLLWTTLCLAAILRRRWADEEHLTFPVLALPLEMTRESAPLYRNRVMWLGFAVPAFFHSLNSLNSLYPSLPSLPINQVRDLVWEAHLPYPWNGMDSLFYLIHPSGVGFGYLVQTDVLFSLWFFQLWKKMLGVLGVSLNWRDPGVGDLAPMFPYTGYQGWGAFLALALMALWAGRAYFGAYVKRALHGDPMKVDRDEPMSARWSLFGFLFGLLLLCAFVWAFGGPLWLPVAFFVVYLLLMTAIARIRAEAGVLSTELMWINPQSILPAITGTRGVSHRELGMMASLSWFNTDYRAPGLSHELEGIVGMHRTRARLRPLVSVILVACAVAIVSALLWDLQMYHANGAATGNVNDWRIYKGSEPWRNLERWINDPKPPDGLAMAGMAGGAAITMLLSFLRARLVGFPFHPVGYALNTSMANDLFWMDMFVAWLLKVSVLRYGGMGMYRRALPFFLGLILGDFVSGSAWSLVSVLLNQNMYRTFPN